jgi:hypothetical protein
MTKISNILESRARAKQNKIKSVEYIIAGTILYFTCIGRG